MKSNISNPISGFIFLKASNSGDGNGNHHTRLTIMLYFIAIKPTVSIVLKISFFVSQGNPIINEKKILVFNWYFKIFSATWNICSFFIPFFIRFNPSSYPDSTPTWTLIPGNFFIADNTLSSKSTFNLASTKKEYDLILVTDNLVNISSGGKNFKVSIKY